jgi:hypothetical protein
MTLWKAWFDVRRKFYLCVVLVTLLMAPGTVITAVQSRQASTRQAPVGQQAEPRVQDAAAGFRRHVEGWIEGDAYLIFAVLATVLSVGGITAQTTASSNLMTLSLPERRRRWMTAQAAVAALLLAALCLWEASILAITGWVSGLGVPTERLGLAVLLTAASAALWIWPSILCTSITRDAVRAALIVVSVMVVLTTLSRLTGTAFTDIGLLARLSGWKGSVPWPPLLVGGALTAAAGWAALRRFERSEY